MDLSFPSTEPVEQPQQTSTADAHQPEEQTTQDAIEDPTQEPPLKSEQDIKIEAQQAKKIKALEDKIAVLKAQIEETKAKKAVVDEQLK
ncbi:hypothetical protein MMC09_002766 [Bachmanniomyces sp. S44760]|nr:hypothetical protein [Bachmanniomyces sp. S44760]